MSAKPKPLTLPGVRKHDFRRRFVDFCHGCRLQYTGWPCGSCVADRLTDLEWKAVLAFRGDYNNAEHLTPTGYRFSTGLHPVPNTDGTFNHVFADFPLADLQTALTGLWTRINV